MRIPPMPSRFLGQVLRGAPPSDWATLALLAIVTLAFMWRLPAIPALWPAALLHGALLAGFAGVMAVMARHEPARWVPALRAVATAGVMFTLYISLAKAPFTAFPWPSDFWLDRIDRVLGLGHSPSLAMERMLTTARLEFFSLIYAYFIPYLYLSIILSCIGLPPAQRGVFLNGFALTYAVSLLGYLFVPSYGPILYLAGQFQAPLHGGMFYQSVVASTASTGGIHGAFPSLHVGASAYFCFFDLRYNRLRGLTYVPLVLLIAISTLLVRYHYLIDIYAGFAIAAAAVIIAPRLQRGWETRRLEIGTPLAGGEVMK